MSKKRFNLTVDLDDDNLFDESVKESILSYARQMAREEVEGSIKDEIVRVVEKVQRDIKDGNIWSPGGSSFNRVLERAIEIELSQLFPNGYRNVLMPMVSDIIKKKIQSIDLTSVVQESVRNSIARLLNVSNNIKE